MSDSFEAVYRMFNPHYVDGELCYMTEKVQDIVRCKDCKYNFYCREENHIAQCERDALLRNPYFFCADGEKEHE